MTDAAKTKQTRTGHLVKLDIFIPHRDNTPESMIEVAHLIKRVESLKLAEGDHGKIEIVETKTKHCQQFSGAAKAV